MMRNSSPSILISVPEYLPNRMLIAGLDVEREDLAFVVRLALADGDHFTFLGLFLGGVRDDDAAPDGFALFDAAHQDAIVKRGEVVATDAVAVGIASPYWVRGPYPCWVKVQGVEGRMAGQSGVSTVALQLPR